MPWMEEENSVKAGSGIFFLILYHYCGKHFWISDCTTRKHSLHKIDKWAKRYLLIYLFILFLPCNSLPQIHPKKAKKKKKKKKVHLLSLLHIFVKLIKNYQCFVNLLAWLLRAIGRVREIATSQKCFSFFKIYGLALWIAGKCFYGKYLVKEWRDVSQWKLIAKKKEIRKVIRRLENCHVFDIGQ